MEKDFYYAELFELYKGLLTDKQRELFESHYMYDLSLSEIAQPLGTTRQSVSDGLRKVRQKLTEYEKTLKVKQKNDALMEIANTLSDVDKEKIINVIGK